MRIAKQVSIWRRGLKPLLLTALFLLWLFTGKAQTADPAVTVTEFSDFQCPYCQRAAVVVEQLRQLYGDNVKFVFKQMPLPMHQYAFKAAEAAVIAQQQRKFWEYHDRLFAASDLSLNALKQIATEIGLKQDEFTQALDTGATRAAVEKDIQDAKQLGVRGTPTFFVNGKIVRGAATLAGLTGAIDGALTRPTAETQELRQTLAANDDSSCENSAGATQASLIKVAFTQETQAASTTTTTASGLTISPTSINFGYQLVGETRSSSSQVVTVTNPSRTADIVITDIAVLGHDRSDFIIDSISRTPPVGICCGNSITFTVYFKPTAPWRAGSRNAKLKIAEGKDDQYVPLTGIGATCGGPLPACQFACADADGDGLNDAWEIAGGIDINNDGLVDATNDWLLTGANPNKPDVFVQYDYLYLPDQGTACTPTPDSPLNPGDPNFSTDCEKRQKCLNNVCRGHTHAPSQAALQIVIDAFATHGITLHIDPNPHAIAELPDSIASIETPEQLAASPECAGPGGVSFATLKNAYFDPKRALVYHYAIFAHYADCDESPFTGTACLDDSECQAIDIALTCDNGRCSNASHCDACAVVGGIRPVSGSSGVAERPGNDFIVSLGSWVDQSFPVTDNLVAGTFMHELGHNFGLFHGGPNNLSGATTNYKPNYLSIMNYSYEFPGIGATDAPGPFLTTTLSPATSYRIDYSDAALPTLFEGALDEIAGVSGPATSKDVTVFWTNFGTCKTYGPSNGTPIDWDAQPPVDVTGNCLPGYTAPGPYTVMGLSADIAPDGQLLALTGGNDWANLIYGFQCWGNQFGHGAPIEAKELTFQEAFTRHIIYPQRKVAISVLDEFSRSNRSTTSSLYHTVTVILLGSDDLNVKEVESSSLRFGGARPIQVEVQDTNGDGKPDVILTLDRAILKLNPRTKSAFLSGWLKNSQEIVAEGKVNSVN